MAACTLDYNLNMKGFRSESPLGKSVVAIEIRMRQRYQLQILQTSVTVNDPTTLALVEDIVSPDFVKVFDYPPHVLASMEFRKLNILDMLESFYLDPSLCECFGPAIESFAIDASCFSSFWGQRICGCSRRGNHKDSGGCSRQGSSFGLGRYGLKKNGSAETKGGAYQCDYSTRKPSLWVFSIFGFI